jgi:drug/metabolite transporter, DME family
MAADLGLGTLPYVAWRSALGGLVIAGSVVLLVAAGHSERARLTTTPRRTWIALVVAGATNAALNLAVFVAFEHTTIALALITFYTYPAIVTLVATRLFGERLDRRRLIALALASAGLALVVLAPVLGQSGLTIDPLGMALAFAAACFQTVYIFVSGRMLSAVSASFSAAFVVTFAGLVFVVLALAGGQLEGLLLPFADGRLWLWVLMAAVVGAALPTTAMLAGVRRIGATRTAVLMMLEPVVGVILVAIFLAERPAPLQIVGGVAVLVAGVILQMAPAPTEPRHGALAPGDA